MAVAVGQALTGRQRLVAEAGTGTGKTFAYLIPAMLSGEKVIVSTGTKHLQDQLFKKDLPTLVNALNLQLKCELLKGRSNYLCLHRLEKALNDSKRASYGDFALMRKLDDWKEMTNSGDRVDFAEMAEDHYLWSRVTSTTDNCLGQECPQYSECFVVKARRAAQEADLLVINHHLFCADLSLKETGFGELLPVAAGIVLDEAHQLPETATRFFGESLNSRRLLDLCKDILTEAWAEASDMPDLLDLVDSLPPRVLRLRQMLGAREQRAAWGPMMKRQAVQKAVAELQTRLDELVALLDIASVRSKGLQSCFGRALVHQKLLKELQTPQEDKIQWFETSRQGFALYSTPIEIADIFRKHIDRLDVGWVFTSATLAVGDDFSHFASRLGLEEAKTGLWGSPFDYAKNALSFLPPNLPEPAHPGYIDAMVDMALPLIDANRGGTFFLFTSYRALQQAQELLRDRCHRPVLVQGEMSRQALIDQFREAGNAVLLATSSFWEGVDVRGMALSCVIIEKLPFAAPGEPVLEARLSAMRAKGQNPFMDYQLPQAVIALKQGAGRLIRDVTDLGLLVLCDPRLRSKPYGRRFMASLPDFPITHDVEQALAFLQKI
ncbi:MAG TPA: ATP-dependent DNA helicase [Gammaproteobacteria bacterium]|nr:ATP-dependent DNA helicase [Gammaproteobacteria bacterium]